LFPKQLLFTFLYQKFPKYPPPPTQKSKAEVLFYTKEGILRLRYSLFLEKKADKQYFFRIFFIAEAGKKKKSKTYKKKIDKKKK